MSWKTRVWSGVLLAVGLAAPMSALAATATREQAIEQAQQAYQQAKQRGVSFDNGPCLGVILPGWVADVAHEPRQPVDNRPENQCAAFRSGEAKHFVELDPQGRVLHVH